MATNRTLTITIDANNAPIIQGLRGLVSLANATAKEINKQLGQGFSTKPIVLGKPDFSAFDQALQKSLVQMEELRKRTQQGLPPINNPIPPDLPSRGDESANALLRLAQAEARGAQTAGDHARAEQILKDALQNTTASALAQQNATNQLITTQQRLNPALDATANTGGRMNLIIGQGSQTIQDFSYGFANARNPVEALTRAFQYSANNMSFLIPLIQSANDEAKLSGQTFGQVFMSSLKGANAVMLGLNVALAVVNIGMGMFGDKTKTAANTASNAQAPLESFRQQMLANIRTTDIATQSTEGYIRALRSLNAQQKAQEFGALYTQQADLQKQLKDVRDKLKLKESNGGGIRGQFGTGGGPSILLQSLRNQEQSLLLQIRATASSIEQSRNVINSIPEASLQTYQAYYNRVKETTVLTEEQNRTMNRELERRREIVRQYNEIGTQAAARRDLQQIEADRRSQNAEIRRQNALNDQRLRIENAEDNRNARRKEAELEIAELRIELSRDRLDGIEKEREAIEAKYLSEKNRIIDLAQIAGQVATTVRTDSKGNKTYIASTDIIEGTSASLALAEAQRKRQEALAKLDLQILREKVDAQYHITQLLAEQNDLADQFRVITGQQVQSTGEWATITQTTLDKIKAASETGDFANLLKNPQRFRFDEQGLAVPSEGKFSDVSKQLGEIGVTERSIFDPNNLDDYYNRLFVLEKQRNSVAMQGIQKEYEYQLQLIELSDKTELEKLDARDKLILATSNKRLAEINKNKERQKQVFYELQVAENRLTYENAGIQRQINDETEVRRLGQMESRFKKEREQITFNYQRDIDAANEKFAFEKQQLELKKGKEGITAGEIQQLELKLTQELGEAKTRQILALFDLEKQKQQEIQSKIIDPALNALEAVITRKRELNQEEIDLERSKYATQKEDLIRALAEREITQAEYLQKLKSLNLENAEFEEKVRIDQMSRTREAAIAVRDVVLNAIKEELKARLASFATKQTISLGEKALEILKRTEVYKTVATTITGKVAETTAVVTANTAQGASNLAVAGTDAIKGATASAASAAKVVPFPFGLIAAAAAGAGFALLIKKLQDDAQKSITTTGFYAGGFTGTGARQEVAGVVHKGEVVFEKPLVDDQKDDLLRIREFMQNGGRIKDLFTLPGYFEGGLVGGELSFRMPTVTQSPMPVINNHITVTAPTMRRRDVIRQNRTATKYEERKR